jgi:hypothetical protein
MLPSLIGLLSRGSPRGMVIGVLYFNLHNTVLDQWELFSFFKYVLRTSSDAGID